MAPDSCRNPRREEADLATTGLLPPLTIANVSAPSKGLCSRAHSATRSTSHFTTRELPLLLVFRPTYDLWLNWIGPEFAATGAYICWRDSRAEAKTDFAPQSPIRQWPD